MEENFVVFKNSGDLCVIISPWFETFPLVSLERRLSLESLLLCQYSFLEPPLHLHRENVTIHGCEYTVTPVLGRSGRVLF